MRSFDDVTLWSIARRNPFVKSTRNSPLKVVTSPRGGIGAAGLFPQSAPLRSSALLRCGGTRRACEFENLLGIYEIWRKIHDKIDSGT